QGAVEVERQQPPFEQLVERLLRIPPLLPEQLGPAVRQGVHSGLPLRCRRRSPMPLPRGRDAVAEQGGGVGPQGGSPQGPAAGLAAPGDRLGETTPEQGQEDRPRQRQPALLSPGPPLYPP